MKTKFWAIFMTAVMALGAVFGLTACGGSGVEKIKIGDTREQVVKVLGEPAEDESSEFTYHYYGKEYTKILDEEKALEEKMLKTTDAEELMKILEAMAILEGKLETLVYEYTTITFDGQGLVSSVRMDARHNAPNPQPKVVKKSSLSTGKGTLYAEKGKPLPYLRVWYTDGSYQCIGWDKIGNAVVASEFWNWTIAVQMTYSEDWGEYTASIKRSKRLKFNPGTWTSGAAGTGTFKATVTEKTKGKKFHELFQEYYDYYDFTLDVEIFASGTFAVTEEDLVWRDAIQSYMFYVMSSYNSVNLLINVTMSEGITAIGSEAFGAFATREIVSLNLPKSLQSIGAYIFDSWSTLTSITYNGTVEDWEAIEKASSWNNCGTDYTITCTDGTIAKDGTVTMFS